MTPVSARNPSDAENGKRDQENESEQIQEEESPVWWLENVLAICTNFKQACVGKRTKLAAFWALLVIGHDGNDHQLRFITAVSEYINT